MGLVEAFWLNGHTTAFQQTCHALLTLFGAGLTTWAGRGIVFSVSFRLRVGGDEPLIVTQHRFARSLTDQILRANRNFATAAGRIDHISRDGIAGRVTAHCLHDLDALADGRAEVASALHEITLVQVIGPAPIAHHLMYKTTLAIQTPIDS